MSLENLPDNNPLASGTLTINANGEAFNTGETFSEIQFEQGVGFAERIKGILPDERTAQWALRWILDHPEVTTVIPGATKIAQVRSNLEASSLPHLPSGTLRQLRALYEEKIKTKIRGHF